MALTYKIARCTSGPLPAPRFCGFLPTYRQASGGCVCPGGEGKPCLLALGPSGSGESGNPGAPTMYDSRKLGHNLSTNNVTPLFETLQNIPTGVFRNTTGEVLGHGAAKLTYYQNPEYFSYHHMSFYDFNIGLRQYRLPVPKSGRKPT